jgi:O-antigen/teichoic acid export membrane protein
LISFFTHKSTRNLIKDSSVYGAGALVNKLIPVALLPILTRYLTPEEYGIVAIFSVYTAIAINFVGFNLPAALMRNYIDFSRNELSQYVGSAFFVIFMGLAFWFGISYSFRGFISQVSTIPANWVPMIIIVAFFQIVISIMQIMWRMERRAAHFAIFQTFLTGSNLGFSILFVVVFLWHWQGRLLGLVFSAVIGGLLGVFFLYQKGYLKFQFKKEQAKSMLLFSVPLIPHTLSMWVMTASDRLFIANMVDVTAVGLYSVGYAVGQLIQLLQHAFSQAWVPFLFENLKKEDAACKIHIVKIIYFHHVVIITLAVILNFCAPFLLKILAGEKFQGSSQFVFWIAAGYAVNGMYRMMIPFLNYAKKTHLAPIASITAALCNLFLNYFLIKLNGPIGAAQATFVSFVIFYVIIFFFSIRVYEMPWLFWIQRK